MPALRDTLKKRSRLFRKALWAWFFFFAAFCFADLLFFRLLFWKLPDESAWAGQPHYHFLHKLNGIAPGSEQSPLVLVVGSSIAIYSILPEQIEAFLNRSFLSSKKGRKKNSKTSPVATPLQAKSIQAQKKHIRVRMLSHQGMTPLHLHALLPDIFRLRPTVILYPTNPVDFRIEQAFVNKNFQALISENMALRTKAQKSFIQTLASKPEFLALAPLHTLRLYGDSLSVNTNTDLLFGSLFAVWRYRNLAQGALEALLQNHFSSARHYQNYAGIFVAGISRRGWVARRFVFPLSQSSFQGTIKFQARPCLFQKNNRPLLLYRLCRSKSNRRLFDLPWPLDNASRQTANFRKTHLALQLYTTDKGFRCSDWKAYTLQKGWQELVFGSSLQDDAANFRFFEGKITAACMDEFSADLRSLRFPRNFGLKVPKVRTQEGREIRREDLLYFSYTDEEYQNSYQKRILNFSRPGAAYLAALHDAKLRLAKEPFRKALPPFEVFQQIRKKIQDQHIKFISWSSPENPLSLSLYKGSAWHNAFEGFIEKSAPGLLRRKKLQGRFRMQDFYDYHHMTYFGAQKMSKVLQEVLFLVKRDELDAFGR